MHGVVGSGNPVMFELRTPLDGLLTFRPSSGRRHFSPLLQRLPFRVTEARRFDRHGKNADFSVNAASIRRTRHLGLAAGNDAAEVLLPSNFFPRETRFVHAGRKG